MRSALKNYFSVTKKEWNGLVILVLLIALALAAPYIYKNVHQTPPQNLQGFDAAVAKIKTVVLADSVSTINTTVSLFRFNPNNLSTQQWQNLGLNTRQIDIIKHYEAKGGRFHNREDLKKIYTITNADYQRLEPYIDLPAKISAANKSIVIELNSTNVKELAKLDGIGIALATRIIRYRDRLGGFYNQNQLKEIFGVDAILYRDIKKQIKVDASRINKININTVTMNNLMVFPYLTYKQKNAVVAYRNQHGNYTSLTDLKNIAIIDDVILRKIEPYITLK